MSEEPAPAHDGLVDVGQLVRMFEDAEDATLTARGESETDRDYYDGKQLSAEEIATLKKRGQPPVIINRIVRKVDFLVGLEKKQRIDPRALPRTPAHEGDADGAGQALRYVADEQDYDAKRSAAWRNLLVEGACGIGVSVEPKGHGRDGAPEMAVKITRVPWDRMFWDPHSAELDFSDAGYLGLVLWMDYDDALAKYPDGKGILDQTLDSAGHSGTYDDKPKFRLWADRVRRRLRIVQIWIRRDGAWHFAEFTKGGILKAGPSPYVRDDGESDCELFFQSAKVNRDNERYGIVREMRSPQDEINKRRSKSLHLLNTAQIVMEHGAVDDVERTRREAAKPDGVIVVNPGHADKFKFETRTDLADGHFQLLQEAKNEIDMMAGNAALQGDALSKTAASGKAIIASQQGGIMELGDLLESLRHLDVRVFRAIWARIRQFWTGEKWIRVTDDERNVKWVALNVDPAELQMLAAQDPDSAARIAGAVGRVAELDCDIIIDEAPDSITPALEQWEALVELAKSGVAIPPDVLVEAAPNLKNKDKIIERMAQPDPAAEAAQELEFRGAAAKVAESEAGAELKRAQAMKTATEAQLAPARFEHEAAEAADGRAERFAMKDAEREDRAADREVKAQPQPRVA